MGLFDHADFSDADVKAEVGASNCLRPVGDPVGDLMHVGLTSHLVSGGSALSETKDESLEQYRLSSVFVVTPLNCNR